MCLPSKVQGYTVQKLAVLVGNLLNWNLGLTLGITPSHTRLYESVESTPLRRAITSDESTWMTGSLFLSAAIGSLVLGLVSAKIGPKSAMLLSGLLQMASWFCVHFAYDILHIYSSRIFAGIAAGAAITILPLYIDEIGQTTNSKASLTISIECWRAFGILIGVTLAPYLQYEYIPIIGILASLAFSMVFPFVQESPYYFLRKGNTSSFEKSLRWFRGIRSLEDRQSAEFEQELTQIKNGAGADTIQVNRICSLNSQSVCSPMGIFFLAVGSQLGGILVVLQLFTFSLQLPKLSTDDGIIVIAITYFIGTLIAMGISSSNRRVLLFVTSLGSALGFLASSLVLTYGRRWDIDEDVIPWIASLLLAVHSLLASVGFVSFSTTVVMENIPKRLQNKLLSLIHCITWLTVFLVIQYYAQIVSRTSLAGLLLLLAIACAHISACSPFLYSGKIYSKEIKLKVNGQSMSNGNFTNTQI
ncbi:uncharacterized protein LOC106091728 [Stomoxys calcitrans]|uniref:Major facilitator superfamily (MFS) profile domain-containing protein n=1 Tax=Stomoxys calcitrans TaxID=35570 RepID=A0A1I8P2P1_STOCA|nr:uncharacterized protein LOC106091728 [Stomoxys calcitrans]